MHSCFCFKVELLKAEKPWVRLAAASVTTADDAETNTQELYRKFQGILNKLTPQMFQKLAEQALDVGDRLGREAHGMCRQDIHKCLSI